MQHPVFLAFHMGRLDPQDRADIMCWRAWLPVLCCTLLVLILAPVIAARTGGLEPRADARHPRIGVSSAIAAEPRGITQCAWRDLHLVTAIEAHGEAQDVPAAKLAAAFFALVDARRACAAGRIDEAFAIYDGIAVALAEVRNE